MAKRVKDIWRKAVTLDNIEASILSAAKGKRHRRDVQSVLADISGTAKRILGEVERGDWRFPAERAAFAIEDGKRRKRREIVHPDFREQIIQHLFVDFMLAPVFLPRFYRWSCGSIPGRGQEGLGRYLLRKVKNAPEKTGWYCQLDVRKCFDTIDADAVYAAISRKIGDRRVLKMARKILDSNTISHADGSVTKRGVPIGLFSSPWFVNIALSAIDRHIKDRCGIYLYGRYIDDLILIHPNRRELKRAIDGASVILGGMGMEWKRPPQIRRWTKIRFTGFHLSRERLEVRDGVFARARRTGAYIHRKKAQRRRVTAFDAEKLVSYGGRFRALGGYNAFVKQVLCGRISMRSMRQKISARDRLRAKANIEKESEEVA